MNFINQSAFLKALGWSLLDSLWQMGLMWIVYVCLTANGKKFQARQRHTIALLSLTGGAIWFLVTLIINFYKAAAAPEVVTVFASELVNTQLPLLAQIATSLEPALPYLSVAYLGVACFLFLRFYRQYYRTRQLYTTGIQKAHPEWRVFLQQALQHMGIKKKVTIWFSSLVDTPLTLGFWKPVILLPVAAVNHLSIQQAEAIILHELNHISRNDYLVNLLIACTDIILFFNPFTRFLTGIIRKEREHSCDDMVLQFRYDPGTYAKALLTLEQNRCGMSSSLALAATGKNQQFLLNRVKRILSRENITAPVSQRLVAFLVSALLIGFIGLYNPGKIITRTIDDVTATPRASVEYAQTFQTPPADKAIPTEEPATPVPDAVAAVVKKDKPAKEDDDGMEQMENLIELAADIKLAAITEKLNEMPDMATFVNAWQTIDYAFQPAAAVKPFEAYNEVYPFVPTSSFSYQYMEDTSLPKKYIMTYTEKKTKEAVDKAILALQSIDWKKLEKEINSGDQKIDIAKLQIEIQKAIKEVDWKKIDEETHGAMMAEEDMARNKEALKTYQQQRVRSQVELKQAQQQVLIDRLAQHERLKQAGADKAKTECSGTNASPAPKAKTAVKKKKIIHI